MVHSIQQMRLFPVCDVLVIFLQCLTANF